MKTESWYSTRSSVEKAYADLLGFVPSALSDKFAVFSGSAEPVLLAIENARALALTPKCFDAKTVQLLQFAIYVALEAQHGATVHASAAFRAGATREELASAAAIAFVASGVPALSLGVAAILEAEKQMS